MSPSVIPGSQPGVTVGDLIVSIGGELGYSADNNRHKNRVIAWIATTLREIQLAEPKMRRSLLRP